MKNLTSTLLFILVICLCAISYADDMYTAEENNAASRENIFDINGNAPWLFLSIPEGNAFKVTLFQWNTPGEAYYLTSYEKNGNWYNFNSFIFRGPDENFNWNDVKSLGTWNIALEYTKNGGGNKSLYTEFTMAPEPVSSILFLVGGAGLAFKQYRKKKINRN